MGSPRLTEAVPVYERTVETLPLRRATLDRIRPSPDGGARSTLVSLGVVMQWMSWMASICLVALVCVFLPGGCGERPGAPNGPGPDDGVEARSDVHALLVGVTRYPHLSGKDLQGPSNDVAYFGRTLREYMGVSDITVLTEEQGDTHKPTRQNIMRELDRLADKAGEGKRVIFLFSGHGSQIANKDPGRDQELDRKDELMLPRDTLGWKDAKKRVVNAILDDEVRVWSKRVRDKGATVWMLFDCCHAGSMSRGPGERSRKVSPEDLGVPAEYQPDTNMPPEGAAPDESDEMRDIVAFYAVPAQTLAKEVAFPRTGADEYKYYGLMTYAVSMAIRKHQRAGARLTFAELERYMRSECRKVPHDQRPWAEGSKRLYVATEGQGGPLLMLENRGDELWLNAGRMRGLSDGTILTAYERGKTGVEDAVVGRVEITGAGIVDSRCKVLETKDGHSLHELPARVTTAVAGDLRIRLHICNEQREPLAPSAYPPELKSALEWPPGTKPENRRFQVVPLADATWLLQQEGKGWFFESSGVEGAPHRIPFMASDLDRALANLFRVQTLLEIARGDHLAQDLPPKLYFEAILPGRAATERAGILSVGPDSEERVAKLESGMSLVPGEPMQIRMRNQTFEPIDLTILNIDAELGVHVLYPPYDQDDDSYGSPRIQGQATSTLVLPGPDQSAPLYDGVGGPEYLLVLAVPRPQVPGPERDDPKRPGKKIRPLVDQDEVDFTGLAQDPLSAHRGKGTDGIAGMLRSMAMGDATSRGGKDSVEPTGLSARLIAYRNGWGSLDVPSAMRSAGTPAPKDARTARAAMRTAMTKPPSPWFVGATITAAPEQEGLAPAVITWDDEVTQIYIDADGDAGIKGASTAQLAEQIKKGALDVELVVRLADSGNMAWYALGSQPDPFTLVLAETAVSSGASTAYKRKGDGSWDRYFRSGAWLNTATFGPLYPYRGPVIMRLHAFRKR